jgi:hypothetical protein
MQSKLNFTDFFLPSTFTPPKWSLPLDDPIEVLNSIVRVISACMLCALFILFSLFESRNFVTCAVRIIKPRVNFGSMWSLDVYLDHAQISLVSNNLDTYFF